VECDARQPISIVAKDGANSLALTSLDRTNVENFSLVGLDFSKTLFAGAINLEKVRIQGNFRFLRAPSRVGQGREAIRDEVAVRSKRRRWRRLASKPADPSGDPQDVARLYRALRKNREDSKDEPGGADFYYGEMEMRRAAARFPGAEWLLLNAYWMLSGYGLRAWRAFASLTLLLLIGGILLRAHGYPGTADQTYTDAILDFLQTSIGLARIPDDATSAGRVTYIFGRLLCPALIGLAALALRGRVKR
jgi:hypothetical protein